jgi:hypothetical protein
MTMKSEMNGVRVCCANCKHYENYWCKHHDSPACPFARCDEFTWSKPVQEDRKTT